MKTTKNAKGSKVSKTKNKKKGFKRIFKVTMLSLLGAAILAVAAACGIIFAIIKTTPDLNLNQITNVSEESRLYDSSSNYMDDVITDVKRTKVPLDSISPDLQHAFISIEDERFYSHNGFDFKRILGVFVIDIKNKIERKSSLQGASTITQQLIRNTILTKEVSIKRKVQEIYLSTQLEKKWTKQQILESYLNTIFLGGKAYGVEAASKQYFNKSAKDLSLVQCAFLAGLTQSPSYYYPFSPQSKRNPNIYLNRTHTVLKKMYDNKYITNAQLTQAVSELKNNKLSFDQSYKSGNKLNYEWFSRPVMYQVKTDLMNKYHYSAEQANALLATGGLKIYTTMDKKIQDSTQSIIDSDPGLNAMSTKYDPKTPSTVTQPQAAATIIDYHTGEIKAIVGGRGTQPTGSYNRAIYNGLASFMKPCGSSIKPLTVYAPAIDSKKATAATVIEDSPLTPDVANLYKDSSGKPYNPTNYGESSDYYGYMTLRDALKHSQNLVAVKLENMIGISMGKQYAQKLGLSINDKYDNIAALSLGELHDGTNTTQMARAYGAFGNNGMLTNSRLYTKVVDRNNVTILQTKVQSSQVYSAQAAYVVNDMLKEPVASDGTAPSANFGSMPIRGKTGTSSELKNLWFVGYTPYYSAAVWVGDDTPKTISSWQWNSNSSAGLWAKIMKAANDGLSVKDFDKPDGIAEETVCKDSGKVPTDLCKKDPRGDRTYSEIFIDGTQPTSICDIHVEDKINAQNGKLATQNTPSNLIVSKIFIKRNYVPTVPLMDEQYAAPLDSDDTPASTTQNTQPQEPQANQAQPNNPPAAQNPQQTQPQVSPPAANGSNGDSDKNSNNNQADNGNH